MSLRRDMLQTARKGRAALGEEAARRAAEFLRERACPNGGFRGRGTAADLYYTVFALQGLHALEMPFDADAAHRYFATFGDGSSLDLVHVSCLARCRAILGIRAENADSLRALCSHLESFRAADGGFNQAPGAAGGSAYGAFLAVAAYDDLAADLPNPAGVTRSLASLRTSDGGYSNEPGGQTGLVPSTAAAVVVLSELSRDVPPDALAWLHQQRLPDGGFPATPLMPVPDLLSTATAPHALGRAGAPLDADDRDVCRAFVLDLLDSSGGFRGHAADPTADAEYTFYGLLALGRLADPPS